VRQRAADRPPFRTSILSTEAPVVDEEAFDPWGFFGNVIPLYTPENVRDVYFLLTYKQHGGSGMNWRPPDVDNLDLGEVQWYVDRLTDQRKKESEALKRARRK
jgi:hypothetical protein